MAKDAQLLEDYIVTMSNTVVLGKQWQPDDHTLTPENLMRPTGLLMYTDRGEVPTVYRRLFLGRIAASARRGPLLQTE